MDFDLGAHGTRNRDGKEAMVGGETLRRHLMSCGGDSRVLTGQLPWHGGSGHCVSLCLCSFSMLVSQTPWKFHEQPNTLSINSFSAGIIQSRVPLLATKDLG